MKAIFLIRNGESRNAFEIREIPVPVPGPGQVIVKVEASGLNYADVMARRGLYKVAPPIPSVLGYDVAGTIHSLGPGTTGLKKGQRVAAMTRFGGYAEYAIAHSGAIIPIDDAMDAALATSLATQATTAVYCSAFVTRLYKGDRILIHAAAGGVGTFLVQLAKSAGCIIYGSASRHKHAYLKERGVDFLVDSLEDDRLHEINKILNGNKLDAVFNNIGGLSFKNELKLLGPGGRMVAYGAAAQNAGEKSNRLHSFRVGLGFGFHSPVGLIVQSKSMIGVNMLTIADNKPLVIKDVMTEVIRLTAEGVLQPVLGKTFPADKIADAHDFLESRVSTGKIAVVW